MNSTSNALETYAQRCIQLAYKCENKTAERLLRLLAVDLMLAAEQQRPRRSMRNDELAELDRLSRDARLKPENASTA
jgi:hypothetical protein